MCVCVFNSAITLPERGMPKRLPIVSDKSGHGTEESGLTFCGYLAISILVCGGVFLPLL